MEISDSKRELTYVFKSMGTTTVRGTSFDSSKENPTALKRADFVVVVDDPKAFLPLVVSGKSALNRGIDNTLFVNQHWEKSIQILHERSIIWEKSI